MRINKSLITYIPTSGSGSGSVTSVALTAPTGFVVSGSPITSSGTLAITFASGYSLPTTTKQGQWDSAYTFVSAFPYGTTGQLVRFNSLGNLEAFTPDYMGNPMTSLGDMIYGNAVGIPLRVAPNTTTTKKYLSMTGDGTNGDQPFWDTIAASIGGSGTTNYVPKFTSSSAIGNSLIYDNGTNVGIGQASPTQKLHIDGNILLSAGLNRFIRIGTSSNYYYDLSGSGDDFDIIEAGTTTRVRIKYPNGDFLIGYLVSSGQKLQVNGDIKFNGVITGGSWQGNAVYPAYGGTGATSLTGVVIGNGTASMTAVAGTSMQLLRRNFANDNYEFFTPDYISSPMTSLGDMIYGNAVGIPLRVPANTSTTKKYLSMTGDGTDGAQPIWDTIPASIGGSGTTNYIPKFSASNAIANSAIYDNSANIVINGTTANGKLTVNAATAGTSLYLTDGTNSSFYITHPSTARTSFFNGAATRWLTEYNGDVGFENKVIVGGSTPLAQFHVKGGTLATSGTGLMVAAEITNGRLETYQASTCQAIHTTSDAHTYEISAGSTTDYVSGLVITARSATLLPDRVAIYTRSAQRLQINGAGQLNLNNYTSATSFTGTPVAYLACDSSGNIITSNPSGTAKYYRVSFSAGVQQTWLNMPSTLDFFDSSSINVTQAELTEFNQVRLVVNKQGTAGATGSKLILRYQDTTGSPFTASSYSDIGTSEVSVTVDVTNTILVSSWINMATLAKDDVWIAVLGIDGDGAADPVFGNIYAEFRYNP